VPRPEEKFDAFTTTSQGRAVESLFGHNQAVSLIARAIELKGAIGTAIPSLNQRKVLSAQNLYWTLYFCKRAADVLQRRKRYQYRPSAKCLTGSIPLLVLCTRCQSIPLTGGFTSQCGCRVVGARTSIFHLGVSALRTL
jgi:hypothetical protein